MVPAASDHPDVLSRAIEDLRLRGASYRHDVRTAPWSCAVDDGMSGVHYVRRGAAQLRGERHTLDLAPGDLVIIPAGVGHVLASPTGVPVGASSEMICGSFVFGAPDHPLLAMLPAFLHVRGDQAVERPQLAEYLQCLAVEVTRPREGSSALIARLSDVVLIEALRLLSTSAPDGAIGGWLVGLRDPALAGALRAMHERPEDRWTIAKLARVAGLSRAAFAERFATMMGEPPMTYFTRWRMFRARTLLRDTTRAIEQIALEIGYGSATAFSFAFQRIHGVPPSAFRRATTAGDPLGT